MTNLKVVGSRALDLPSIFWKNRQFKTQMCSPDVWIPVLIWVNHKKTLK